jgi:hypothetical protein
MVSCYKKMATNESEIRFDPNISDRGDLAISHAIVGVNKLFKNFFIPFIMTFFVVYPWQNKILLMNMELQQFNILKIVFVKCTIYGFFSCF